MCIGQSSAAWMTQAWAYKIQVGLSKKGGPNVIIQLLFICFSVFPLNMLSADMAAEPGMCRSMFKKKCSKTSIIMCVKQCFVVVVVVLLALLIQLTAYTTDEKTKVCGFYVSFQQQK